MNGDGQINEDELLDILERITSAQFAKLIFKLKVPKNLMPGEDKAQTLRAIALIEWAKAQGGCELETIPQILKGMGIRLSQLPCALKAPMKFIN